MKQNIGAGAKTEVNVKWVQQKIKLKEKFTFLTDGDLEYANGKEEEMMEKLQAILENPDSDLKKIIDEFIAIIKLFPKKMYDISLRRVCAESFSLKDIMIQSIKVLFVTTSNDKLGDTNTLTGYGWKNLPLLIIFFKDAGIDITVASPKGGPVPMDPKSQSIIVATQSSRRFLKDADAMKMLSNSISFAGDKSC
jgi:uncharacterized protein YjbJ (UPF0337 family)